MKLTKIVVSIFVSCTLIGCTQQSESTVVNISSKTEIQWQYDGSETTIPSKKDETVNIQADASGTPIKTTVHTKLSNINSDKVIEDISNVTDISNSEGDEQFEQKDGKIYWQNLGDDISYTGVSDENLPIELKIRYYLDDNEISADEIAGKSGHIKIRFEYINQTSYESVHVPFACASIVMLDTNLFSNITVNHGKVSESDGTAIVLGYAFPSLKEDLNLSSYENIDLEIPESVEVEADTDAFTLNFTETLISNGLFNEIEDEDLDDLQELSDSFLDLGEAGDSLVSGGSKLKDAFSKLQEGMNAYLDGIEQLTSGVQQLSDVSSQINENTSTLVQGTKELSDTFNSIDVNTVSSTVMTEIQNDLNTLQTLSISLQAVSESLTTFETTLDSILENKNLSDEEKNLIQEQFDAMNQTISGIQEQLMSVLQDINTKVTSINVDEMKTQLKSLQDATNSISEGTKVLSDGISGLNDGISKVHTALKSATQNNTSIKEAMSQLSNGFTEFQKGIEELNTDGLQKLKDKGGVELSSLLDKIQLLKQADASYSSYTGLSQGQDGSVTFMIETSKISKD